MVFVCLLVIHMRGEGGEAGSFCGSDEGKVSVLKKHTKGWKYDCKNDFKQFHLSSCFLKESKGFFGRPVYIQYAQLAAQDTGAVSINS